MNANYNYDGLGERESCIGGEQKYIGGEQKNCDNANSNNAIMMHNNADIIFTHKLITCVIHELKCSQHKTSMYILYICSKPHFLFFFFLGNAQ